MSGGISVLVGLLLVSAMLAVILALAWFSFGRPRHAASWSAAFAVAALQWLAKLTIPPEAAQQFPAAALFAILALAVPSLLLLGFIQRGGRGRRQRIALAATAGFAAVLCVGAALGGSTAFLMEVPLIYRAAVLALASRFLVPRGRPGNYAERAMAIMLWIFAAHSLALAVLTAVRVNGGFAAYAWIERYALLVGVPAALTGVGLFAVLLLAADLAERMQDLATRDPLTSVLNRRGFEDAAARLLLSSRRRAAPMCVVLADIDRFKAINDRLGHAGGDRALCRVADHIAASIRAGDLFGRVGGEEFAMVLVDVEHTVAREVVERIRAGIAEIELDGRGGGELTVSFGISCVQNPDETLEAVLRRADEALYRSKLDGRNRVTVQAAAPAGLELA